MHRYTFPYLAHIGRLDLSEKRPGSYEGSGVSVSVHPAAWGRIARIGLDGFILKKADGTDTELVDAVGLTKQQREDVVSWSREEGLLEDREIWVASYFDEEFECRRSFECSSREEAKTELQDLPRKRISGPKTAISATAKLLSSEGQPQGGIASSSLTFDLALMQYVQANLDADGIWWNERLDVDGYSAPRGVIVASKLESFLKKEVSFHHMDEESCIFDEEFDVEDELTM